MRLLIQTLIFALLLAGIGTTALAGEFSIVPNFQVGSRYDSNARFLPDGTETNGSLGIIFDVSLPLLYRTPKSTISLTPRVVRSFYRKEENANLEDRDAYLTGGADRSFRRSSIGAGYGYTNLSLRTSELANPGDPPPGEPPSGGGILFINEDTQKSWYFQPNWQYQISLVDVVSLNGGYREVRYDTQRTASRLFDYETSNATAAFRHAFNERHSLALQANLSKFDSKNETLRTTNESTSNGLSMVYTHSWSDRSSISANIGWARTKSEVRSPNAFFPGLGFICDPRLTVCISKFDSTNFVGNLTAIRRTETGSYRFVIGQTITPSSNGAQQLRSSINATASKRFSERFSGLMGILAYTETNVGDSQFDRSGNYIRGNLGLNYRLTRNWSLYGTYFYTHQKFDNFLSNNITNSNHFVSVGVRFQGDGWRW